MTDEPYDICVQRYESTFIDEDGKPLPGPVGGIEDAECTMQFNLEFNDVAIFRRDEQPRPIELYCTLKSDDRVGIVIDLTIEAAERIQKALTEILEDERRES
jgi:hypothetical protein